MIAPPDSAASRADRNGSSSVLLPREHGAYGQLLFPIATALVLGDRALAAFAISVASAAAFVGHEAVLTLLGHRGARASRERRRRATGWLLACSAVVGALGTWSFERMATAARFSLLLPLVFALLLVPFIWSRREHSTAGEIVAAIGLSSCSVPAALAGGVASTRAVTSWLVFALSFVVATLAVRSIIARIRNARIASGDGVRFANRGAAWLAAGVIAISLVLADRGWMPRAAPIALLPVCALAGGLALFPPHPRHLRTVGWCLVTATVVTAVVLAVVP